MTDLIGLVLIVALMAGLAWFVFYLIDRSSVRKMTVHELRRAAFCFDREYFEFLGLEHRSVNRYKDLAEARDLEALNCEWKGLEKDFRKLEREAGHEGRPLIMDYFGPQQMVYSELRRRGG